MSQKKAVYRIYICKKNKFAVEAEAVLNDLKLVLGIKGIEELRIFNRYDFSDISQAVFDRAVHEVLSEAPLDDILSGTYQFNEWNYYLPVEPLPGQYDQRADAACQCVQVVDGNTLPLCRTAKVYAFKGDLTEAERTAIEKWLINPVESRKASMELPDSLAAEAITVPDIPVLNGFCELEQEGLSELLQTYGFAMTLADITEARDYFRQCGREPNLAELRVLDTYWSDHCRHSTFNTIIEKVSFEEAKLNQACRKGWESFLEDHRTVGGGKRSHKALTLMELATQGTRVLRERGLCDDVDQSEEINACSIKRPVTVNGEAQPYLIQFKNETHNHPTEIEPYGGAATCLGGAIRDPLSGRAYVYQAMRVSGSGDPRTPIEQTRKGKLPQLKITKTAAHGYSSYGNQIGLATGHVRELYHPGYVAKRMEVGAVIAAVPESSVRRETPLAGDHVILIGGRTGRDGIGGATGSSKVHTEESLATGGSEVQKGNPLTERNLQRLFRKPEFSRMIRRCNDFGAGGVAVAIGELAPGLEINLDLVPRKYEGLNGLELAISESQERMAVLVAAEDCAKVIAMAADENLEATDVAKVTEERVLRMSWRGQTIVKLDRDFLDTNGARQYCEVHVEAPCEQALQTYFAEERVGSFSELLCSELSSLKSCSQKGLIERFDSSVGAGTCLAPFGGRDQLSPEMGMAGLIPSTEEVSTAGLMSFGFDPNLSILSPYHGAYFAVLDSLAKIAAMGGDPSRARLSFQEYFERMTSPTAWGKVLSALVGAYRAQMDFGVPAIGGKDSMSGSFEELQVPPTLISFAVDSCEAEDLLSASLLRTGLNLYQLKAELNSDFLPNSKKWISQVQGLKHYMLKHKAEALFTSSTEAPAVAAVKATFGQGLGLDFNAELSPGDLFLPAPGSLIVAFATALSAEEVESLGLVPFARTTGERFFRYGSEKLDFETALETWKKPLDQIFPEKSKGHSESAKNTIKDTVVPKTSIKLQRSTFNFTKPRVLVAVFPGTNSEDDTCKAFRLAGAEVTECRILNFSQSALKDSLERFAALIRQSQILALPGGFSAGDEPEGSAKFIISVMRNSIVKEALDEFLETRGGLLLGICNGFQALVKLGLLPYGRMQSQDQDSATLTYNTIGRHVARYAETVCVNNNSPWLVKTEVGARYQVPISHGEGRFIASPAVLAEIEQNSQVAFRYAQAEGSAEVEALWNPNGSMNAIESIISPNGQVLGKMGHSERCGKYVGLNIPGEKIQPIFESAVSWFAE